MVKKTILLFSMLTCLSFLLLSPVAKADGPTATAWCGSDSYVDCSGGDHCIAIDNRYCACYYSDNRLKMKRSCKFASGYDTE